MRPHRRWYTKSKGISTFPKGLLLGDLVSLVVSHDVFFARKFRKGGVVQVSRKSARGAWWENQPLAGVLPVLWTLNDVLCEGGHVGEKLTAAVARGALVLVSKPDVVEAARRGFCDKADPGVLAHVRPGTGKQVGV